MAPPTGYEDTQTPSYSLDVMPVVSTKTPMALPDAKKEAAKLKPAKTAGRNKFTPPKGYELLDDSGEGATNFTSNPQGEGLYRMGSYDFSNGSVTKPEVSVPFSKVQSAISAGYKLHPDENPRYQKDVTYQGQGPTPWERTKGAFAAMTEPMPDTPLEFTTNPTLGSAIRSAPAALSNVGKMPFNVVNRTVRGVVGLPGQVVEQIKGIAEGKPEALESFNPVAMGESEWKGVEQDKDNLGPVAALSNVLGDAGTMAVTLKAGNEISGLIYGRLGSRPPKAAEPARPASPPPAIDEGGGGGGGSAPPPPSAPPAPSGPVAASPTAAEPQSAAPRTAPTTYAEPKTPARSSAPPAPPDAPTIVFDQTPGNLPKPAWVPGQPPTGRFGVTLHSKHGGLRSASIPAETIYQMYADAVRNEATVPWQPHSPEEIAERLNMTSADKAHADSIHFPEGLPKNTTYVPGSRPIPHSREFLIDRYVDMVKHGYPPELAASEWGLNQGEVAAANKRFFSKETEAPAATTTPEEPVSADPQAEAPATTTETPAQESVAVPQGTPAPEMHPDEPVSAEPQAQAGPVVPVPAALKSPANQSTGDQPAPQAGTQTAAPAAQPKPKFVKVKKAKRPSWQVKGTNIVVTEESPGSFYVYDGEEVIDSFGSYKEAKGAAEQAVQKARDAVPAPVSAPTTQTETQLAPHGAVSVDLQFPVLKEDEPKWVAASNNQALAGQFARLGISGFSVEAPHRFGLSEQGNIEPGTGVMRISAAAEDPEETIAHELSHDIYNRLPTEVQERINHYVLGRGIEDQMDNLEERVVTHFSNAMLGRGELPDDLRKLFFESPLGSRPEQNPRAAQPETPEEPRPAFNRSWAEVAQYGGGNLRQGDDIAAIVKQDGDFPLVVKDTYGARHVMPASVAAEVMKDPVAGGYVDSVFMAKDHQAEKHTEKIEEDIASYRAMVAAGRFQGAGKSPTGPPMSEAQKVEWQAKIDELEKELDLRNAPAYVYAPRPLPSAEKQLHLDQRSGAKPLLRAARRADKAHRVIAAAGAAPEQGTAEAPPEAQSGRRMAVPYKFISAEKLRNEEHYDHSPGEVWRVHTDAGDVDVFNHAGEGEQEAMDEAAKILGQNLAHGVSPVRLFNQGTYKPNHNILHHEDKFKAEYKKLAATSAPAQAEGEAESAAPETAEPAGKKKSKRGKSDDQMPLFRMDRVAPVKPPSPPPPAMPTRQRTTTALRETLPGAKDWFVKANKTYDELQRMQKELIAVDQEIANLMQTANQLSGSAPVPTIHRLRQELDSLNQRRRSIHQYLSEQEQEYARLNAADPNVGEVRLDGQGNPTLYLNRTAMGIIQQLMEPGREGVIRGSDWTVKDARWVHNRMREARPAGVNEERIWRPVMRLLETAMARSRQGGISLVGKMGEGIHAAIDTAREEFMHRWQRSRTANGMTDTHLTKDAFWRLFSAMPDAAHDYLRNNGYPLDGHLYVIEAAAKIMANKYDKMGLTEDQALDWLERYFDEVSQHHGPQAVTEINHTAGAARDLQQDWEKQYGSGQPRTSSAATRATATTDTKPDAGRPLSSVEDGGPGESTGSAAQGEKGRLDRERPPQTLEQEDWLTTAVHQFADQHGFEFTTDSGKVTPDERAMEIADAYEAMPHEPKNPQVKASYDALKRDIDTQWDYAVDQMGMSFEPWNDPGQPYANSAEMVADVKKNHHLFFFRGGELPSDHPMAEVDRKTGFTYNEKVRAIHDLFGHAVRSNQFGAQGEENAWIDHAQMFSREAIPALTSETKGQNSWVNFGPNMRGQDGKLLKKGDPGWLAATDRPYAENKAGLLPSRFHYRTDAPVSFVSPNVYSLDSVTDANRRLNSIIHEQFTEQANALANDLGLRVVIEPVIGAWQGGAENAIAIHYPMGTSPEMVRYFESNLGHLGYQNATANFTSDPAGSDHAYFFWVKDTNADNLSRVLITNGIESSTIVPASGGHGVMVIGKGDTLRDKIDNATSELGVTSVRQHAGRAEFPGDYESRDAAERQFLGRIEEVESRRPSLREIRRRWTNRPGYNLLHSQIREADAKHRQRPFVDVVHYSDHADIKELDPSRYGENAFHEVSKQRVKRPDEVRKDAYPQHWSPEAYTGDDSDPVFREKAAERFGKRQYTYKGRIPEHQIYDMPSDPHKLRERSRQELLDRSKEKYGVKMPPSETEVDAYTISKLKALGYTARRDVNGLIASWEKVPVERANPYPEDDVRKFSDPSAEENISHELSYGDGSPYSQAFPSLYDLPYEQAMAITQDVMNKVIDIAAKEGGVDIVQNSYGAGGFLNYPVQPSGQTVVKGSPKAVDRFMDLVGFLAQQTEVLGSHPDINGGDHALQIVDMGGDKLSDPERVAAFWNDLQAAVPEFQGFQPVLVDGKPGIRIVTSGSHMDAILDRVSAAIENLAQKHDIMAVADNFAMEVKRAGNDWKTDPQGGGYLSRLGQTGRPDLLGRLDDHSRRVKGAIQDAYRKHTGREAGQPEPRAGQPELGQSAPSNEPPPDNLPATAPPDEQPPQLFDRERGHSRMAAREAGNLISYQQAKEVFRGALPPEAAKDAISRTYALTGGNKWLTPSQLDGIGRWALREHGYSDEEEDAAPQRFDRGTKQVLDLDTLKRESHLRRELAQFNPNAHMGEENAAALIAPDGRVALGDYHNNIKGAVGYGRYKGSSWEQKFLVDGGVRVRARGGETNLEFGADDEDTIQRVRDVIDALPGNEFYIDFTPDYTKGGTGTTFWQGDRRDTLRKLDKFEVRVRSGRATPAYGSVAYWREQWGEDESRPARFDRERPENSTDKYQTGKPVAIPYLHNTQPSPRMGRRFGQDVEPAGKYIQARTESYVPEGKRWETGVTKFENPLVIDFGGGYQEPSNWKNVLSKRFGGKKGRELSEAIRAAGHDAVITTERVRGEIVPSEIVDLTNDSADETRPRRFDRENKPLSLQEAQEQAEELRPKGSTVPLMTAALVPRYSVIADNKGLGEMSTIAGHLQSVTRRSLKPLLPKGNTRRRNAMVRRAVEIATDELKYQLAQDNSGADWYKSDIDELIGWMKRLHPELKYPTRARMFRAIAATTSPGHTASFDNIDIAEEAYRIYKDTGKIPLQRPDGTAWGTYGNAPLVTLQAVLDHFDGDEAQAMRWLLTKHTRAELEDAKSSSGFNKSTVKNALPPDADEDNLYGAYIFGAKVGPFFLNLNGISSELTVDRWFMRTWNRWMGTLVGTDGQIQDRERGKTERAAMLESITELEKMFNLETSQVQAALWYYEQGLYGKLGQSGTFGGTYADAGRKVFELRSNPDAEFGGANDRGWKDAHKGRVPRGNGAHSGKARGKDTEGERGRSTGFLFGDNTSFDPAELDPAAFREQALKNLRRGLSPTE